MKINKINKKWGMKTALIFGIVFNLIGCGSSGTSASSSTDADFETQEGDTAFYSAALNTAPVIVASTTSESLTLEKNLLSGSLSWESGNPAYEIFNTFREYQYPRDEGVIDVSNVYKLLFEAGNNYSTALDSVSELSTATMILPPYIFGNSVKNYTHASDHYALLRDGDDVSAILTWIWDESPKMSYGVLEGTFNETTGDVSIDMVYLVDYDGDQDYCLRTQIIGNSLTNEFTLRTGKYNTGTGAYAVSMVGVGVSQSTDSDAYFIIKVIDNESLADGARYYKFSSSADEDDFAAYPSNGYALEDIEDPNAYATTIDALTPFALDGSDHAISVGHFSYPDLILSY